ncbi:hypothetical protein A2V55_00935 [Candidatus Woesebacteria bacterium RBG_19FT_COMBO_37_29]|uniref:Uncharacterized protein n=1 Tax=Candidatus Woesebacteria bacterium RBG_19FT_COMBO_37_29 TaxID=1802486 RepID=A0A1F7XMJ7_9BACT|nr:MAG: hypothetical protein A2V55_00935 [Candidatus Woesebacteria bacterium RBG_19FT_COMBO_37_29]
MLEFEKTSEEIRRYLEISRNGFREAWGGFRNAEESYKKAVQAREDMLQSALKEKGLAVCSYSHSWEGVEHPSAEQLGIYPRNQMLLYFYKMGPYDIQGEYEDSIGVTTRLHLCCPEHFPKKSEWIFRQDEDGFTHINSEVVQQEGKFILVVNGSDITRLVNRGGSDIEPDGKRLFLLDPVVYRYFGIPDLPEKPDLDTVQYGA